MGGKIVLNLNISQINFGISEVDHQNVQYNRNFVRKTVGIPRETWYSLIKLLRFPKETLHSLSKALQYSFPSHPILFPSPLLCSLAKVLHFHSKFAFACLCFGKIHKVSLEMQTICERMQKFCGNLEN